MRRRSRSKAVAPSPRPDDSTRAAFTDKLEDLAVVWQSLNAVEVTPATCHSYKVDVILATGNERGSDAATVTRP